MCERREAVAKYYLDSMANIPEISLPPNDSDRLHSWHLFPIRLNLNELTIDRNDFVEELKRNRVGFSVHWRPLHMHPLYAERFGWIDADFPAAKVVDGDNQPSTLLCDDSRRNGPCGRNG